MQHATHAELNFKRSFNPRRPLKDVAKHRPNLDHGNIMRNNLWDHK